MYIDCTICVDRIENPENISVSRCGHVFHFDCLTMFVQKPSECPACSKMISLATITQIHPKIVVRQEEECNQDPSQNTTNAEQNQPEPGKENSQRVKLKESLEISQHLESPKSEDRSSGLQSPLNSKSPLQHPIEQIAKLKLKVKKLEVQKKRYYKRNIDLKKTSQTVLDEAKKAIDDFKKLQELNTQNDVVIKNLKENNETLQKELQALTTKLASNEKDLETKTKDLAIQNDSMKRHLITLNKHFSCYDSAINEFSETILNDNKLGEHILTLQKEIIELKRKLNTCNSQEIGETASEDNNTATDRDTPIQEPVDTTEENVCSSSMRIGQAINRLEDL